jgi:hypothetical protein
MTLELLKSKTGRTLIEDLTDFIVAFVRRVSVDGAGLNWSRFCGNLSGLSVNKK